METRIAIIGIIVEDVDATGDVNESCTIMANTRSSVNGTSLSRKESEYYQHCDRCADGCH